jgi:hypothetical protein
MRVVLTGSFNGQDSLGDECLLQAVVERTRHHRPDCQIVIQLHDADVAFIQGLAVSAKIEVEQGLQSVIWRMSHVLQRLRVPSTLAEALATRGVSVAAALDVFDGRAPVESLRGADAFFIYGGTQFSGIWFALNGPAYLKSAEIVRRAGGKIFFCPQQFGPMAPENADTLRGALTGIVNDWRTRNRLDLDLLEPDPAIS